MPLEREGGITLAEQIQAVILQGVGGLYSVLSQKDETEYVLRARGIFRREKRTPLVGDHVLCTPGRGKEHGWIDDILPRTSECLRPPVANVEQLVMVVAPSPQPDLLLIDRLTVWALRAGIEPILCVNKLDCDKALGEVLCAQYKSSGIRVLLVSAATGEGIEALRSVLSQRISCFAGQSAVGKSSLINALYGLQLPTGDLSRMERGRHTTRHARLLRCGDALVVDTPGFSLLELWEDLEPEALGAYYPEFGIYGARCRFQPCFHDREPGCAVREAAEHSELSPLRLERYQTLLAEVREHWRRRYD